VQPTAPLNQFNPCHVAFQIVNCDAQHFGKPKQAKVHHFTSGSLFGAFPMQENGG
jgi:hypothetical protein